MGLLGVIVLLWVFIMAFSLPFVNEWTLWITFWVIVFRKVVMQTLIFLVETALASWWFLSGFCGRIIENTRGK